MRHNLDRFADDLIGNLADRYPEELLDSRTLARLPALRAPQQTRHQIPRPRRTQMVARAL